MKTKKGIKIFNIPIVCSDRTSLEDYSKIKIEESKGLSEALDEGYEIIATHSLTLTNAGYIAFVLCKEVEIDGDKQMEQEDLQSD